MASIIFILTLCMILWNEILKGDQATSCLLNINNVDTGNQNQILCSEIILNNFAANFFLFCDELLLRSNLPDSFKGSFDIKKNKKREIQK